MPLPACWRWPPIYGDSDLPVQTHAAIDRPYAYFEYRQVGVVDPDGLVAALA